MHQPDQPENYSYAVWKIVLSGPTYSPNVFLGNKSTNGAAFKPLYKLTLLRILCFGTCSYQYIANDIKIIKQQQNNKNSAFKSLWIVFTADLNINIRCHHQPLLSLKLIHLLFTAKDPMLCPSRRLLCKWLHLTEVSLRFVCFAPSFLVAHWRSGWLATACSINESSCTWLQQTPVSYKKRRDSQWRSAHRVVTCRACFNVLVEYMRHCTIACWNQLSTWIFCIWRMFKFQRGFSHVCLQPARPASLGH